nr:hypothetical protein [Tanacetum cinerariifolium]
DKALLMQAKEKGAVLDAEAKAFLADVECKTPYDHHWHSRLPTCLKPIMKMHMIMMWMKDLMPLQLSWPIFLPHVAQTEMQQEEHLNSEVDSLLDENMITYDEYQNDSGVEAVPTVVSADEADKQSMIAVLQRVHTEIAG